MKILYDLTYSLYKYFNKNKFLQTLKQSFTMMLPILMIGSIALLLQSFPIDPIRIFIIEFSDGIIYKILTLIYQITFGFSSVYLLIILTSRYYKILSNRPTMSIYVCVNAIMCYFVLLGPSVFFDGKSVLNYTNMNNIFMAIATAFVSTIIFHFIIENICSKSNKATFTSSYSSAIKIIKPIIISLMIFLTISISIYIISKKNVNDFIVNFLVFPFEKMGPSYWGGLLINLASGFLFFFGIHGRSVYESVYSDVFLASKGGIASNSFFECFTLIGGVGSTLCLIVALILFTKSRKKRRNSIAASVPMIFNINEIIIFGVPIIFNPLYIIPFLLVPLVNYSVAYFFVVQGFIPKIAPTFQWTTPVFINSYLGTSSINGPVVQFICLVIGILIYVPFVMLDNKVSAKFSQEMDNELKQYLVNCDKEMIEPKIFGLNNHLEMHAENILLYLERSIKEGKIDLFYQPLIKDGKIVSAEALLRFKYSESSYIFPPIIVQIAHEKDIFIDLSIEIVKRAIKDFKEILLIRPKFKISINLDLDILFDDKFLDWFISYVKEENIPLYQLGVEVTEKSKLSVSTNLQDLLVRLHENGILIYMDDFSMGHTSIMFLQNASFDYVKLDGSLVKNINNARSKDIVSSIVKLGQSLNFEVIAEYVETIEQKEELEKLGCYLYQGYLYSKAIPFIQLLYLLSSKYKNN